VATFRIRKGSAADAPAVVGLFDAAVAWLVARGQEGQWGTTPWSQRPELVARAYAWAQGDGLRIAEEDGAWSGRFDVRGWIGQVLTMRLVP
jgi:hypothetical protein